MVEIPLHHIILRAEFKQKLITEIIMHNFVDIIEENSLEMKSKLLNKAENY